MRFMYFVCLYIGISATTFSLLPWTQAVSIENIIELSLLRHMAEWSEYGLIIGQKLLKMKLVYAVFTFPGSIYI